MGTRIRCAASDCAFFDLNTGCCTAKAISLSDAYVHTAYNGLQHYNTCRNYTMAPEVSTLAAQLKEMYAFGEAEKAQQA